MTGLLRLRGLTLIFRDMDINYDQTYNMSMKRYAAAKFKEQCLSILDRVDPEGILVTKHGKPVAKLVPVGGGVADLIGSMKGRLRIKRAIRSTGIKWDAESRHPRPAARARRRAQRG